jgi:hypothetical protein
MPTSDLDHLAAEVRELHGDALEAARVAQLCQVAAGQRLNEIRDSMRAIDWHKRVRSPYCPLPRALVARYMVAAQEGG